MGSTKSRDITRQVYNLFQEPVKQPLLGFRTAEKKTDRVKQISNWTPTMDSLTQKTMEKFSKQRQIEPS